MPLHPQHQLPLMSPWWSVKTLCFRVHTYRCSGNGRKEQPDEPWLSEHRGVENKMRVRVVLCMETEEEMVWEMHCDSVGFQSSEFWHVFLARAHGVHNGHCVCMQLMHRMCSHICGGDGHSCMYYLWAVCSPVCHQYFMPYISVVHEVFTVWGISVICCVSVASVLMCMCGSVSNVECGRRELWYPLRAFLYNHLSVITHISTTTLKNLKRFQ